MDALLIAAYEKVIEDISYDIGHAPGNKAIILNALRHRVWELENWEQFSTLEENNEDSQ